MLHVHTQVHDHFENVISTQQDCSFFNKNLLLEDKTDFKSLYYIALFQVLVLGVLGNCKRSNVLLQ